MLLPAALVTIPFMDTRRCGLIFDALRKTAYLRNPFGTPKFWMESPHFQMKTLKRVGTEMALHLLDYNFKRVMNIMGIAPMIAAIRAA